MLRKILFTKITNQAANIFWLFALWYAIYELTTWNSYGWDCPRPSPNYGGYGVFVGWALLTTEFSLNFPTKSLICRIASGIMALFFLFAALPVY